MPAPTIFWNVDASGDWATGADWSFGRVPGAADDVAIDTAGFHTITHGSGTDTVHTLAVGNDDFAITGGSLTINSTSSFANRLTVSAGTLALGGDATAASFVAQGAGPPATLSGAGTLTVTGPASFQLLAQTGPGATILQGASVFLRSNFLDGGRVLENEGTLTTKGQTYIGLGDNPFGADLGGGMLKNDAGATMNLIISHIYGGAGATRFINDGTLNVGTARTHGSSSIAVNFINTGGINILNGNLYFTGGNASFRGKVSGHGFLQFEGGTQALNRGAKLTVSHWIVGVSYDNVADTVFVNEKLAYARQFIQYAGTTLTVAAGRNVRLTGFSYLYGTVNGAGQVELSRGFLNGLSLGGAATLKDVGKVEQFGDIVLGDAGPAGATLLIESGATYQIINGGDIARGSSEASRIRNRGLLIKSGGGGTSTIAVRTVDTGGIEAAKGRLEFTKAIRGDGAMAVDSGATLQFNRSAAAALGLTFNGGAGTLALGAPAKFAATLGGFSATDTIDLLNTLATAATLGAGDTLVIKNGAATVATLQLAGDYSGAAFNVASDGHGGTNITVTTPPGAALAPALAPAAVAGHRFAAAMAGFGGDSHGPATMWIESHGDHAEAFRPMLSAPRMHFA